MDEALQRNSGVLHLEPLEALARDAEDLVGPPAGNIVLLLLGRVLALFAPVESEARP